MWIAIMLCQSRYVSNGKLANLFPVVHELTYIRLLPQYYKHDFSQGRERTLLFGAPITNSSLKSSDYNSMRFTLSNQKQILVHTKTSLSLLLFIHYSVFLGFIFVSLVTKQVNVHILSILDANLSLLLLCLLPHLYLSYFVYLDIHHRLE